MAEIPTTSPSTTPSAQQELQKIYTLPSRLQYVASSCNIDDASEPMRVGQICGFIKLLVSKDSGDEEIWVGIATGQIFSPRWRGSHSAHIFDEDPSVLKGSKAYEVIVKQPVKKDYTTDRTEVTPTGRIAGKVISVGNAGVVYVLMEDWFVDSDKFKMGQWRDVSSKPPRSGDEVRMEVAVPGGGSEYIEGRIL